MVKYEIGVVAGSVVLKKLEGAFQGPKLDDGGPLYELANKKTQAPAGTEARLICKSFGWITWWSSLAGRSTADEQQ
jgi:hypothetical protein